MTVELLQKLSIISYIAAGVLLLVTIALFFLLGVPKLFGDVTGTTARKAIEAIRQQNENNGDVGYKPKQNTVTRGKVTDKISRSGQLMSKSVDIDTAIATERIDIINSKSCSAETTVLEQKSSETTILGTAESGTTVIGRASYYNDTTVLSSDQIMNNDSLESFGEELKVDIEMGFVASCELIE